MSSQGTECPPVCHSPAPVICQDGEVYCDNGSSGGCHLGNTCMPAGIWFIDSFSINEIIVLFKQFKSAMINLSSSLPYSSPRRMCSGWSVLWCWFYSRSERQRDKSIQYVDVTYFQDVAMAIPACLQAQYAHMFAISQLQQFVQQERFGSKCTGDL